MDADLMRRNPGSPYAPMRGPHKSDGNPTLDVTVHPRVGFPPLCGQATGYPFQGSRRLYTQQSIHQGNKGGEVPELLEACLQVYLLLCPFRLLQALLRLLPRIGLGISIHDTHVVNNFSPILLEVTDQ